MGIGGFFVALIGLSGCGGSDAPPPPETLLVNGTIYIDADRKVNNLLVRDGVVAAHDVVAAAHPCATVVDLKGAAACPGFVDSHVHLVSMAAALAILAPTPGQTDPNKIIEPVGARRHPVPKGMPVMGHGFVMTDHDAWYLADLARLDAATGSDCPVMIADQLGHGYIVNTAAMRISGLDANTADPPGGRSAWTSWPNRLGNTGLNAVTVDDSSGAQFNIYRIVDKAEPLGQDLHYHVGGDRAIDAVLGAIEAAQTKHGSLRGRHTLYHLGRITDAQIARMQRLGDQVVAGVPPSLHWQAQSAQTAYHHGEHAARAYPYRKLRDAGIPLAFSSDFASNSVALRWPTEIMRVACTGGANPQSNAPLALRDLIQGFIQAGYTSARAHGLGTLEVGKHADIVVYEKDLSTVPAAELGKDNPRVLSTWVAGQKVPR
ncbi:MAG: hypothetical protein OHK0048_23720 [Rhodoferax sp.]